MCTHAVEGISNVISNSKLLTALNTDSVVDIDFKLSKPKLIFFKALDIPPQQGDAMLLACMLPCPSYFLCSHNETSNVILLRFLEKEYVEPFNVHDQYCIRNVLWGNRGICHGEEKLIM